MATTTGSERLRAASQGLAKALTDKTVGSVDRRVTNLTDRMTSMAANGGLGSAGSGLTKGVLSGATSGLVKGAAGSVKETVTGIGGTVASAAKGVAAKVPHGDKDSAESGGGEGGSETKLTTIIEEIDVGVPISLAYNQWTEFGSFPSFMKKVETVDAVEDQKLHWKAQIWWSHREWESTILEQSPDERIVWRSKGAKGYVDGAVTFHELAPDLTRIILVLEYHPQGLFERTANLWRAQGRRVRAELQHFRRHVMAHAILAPDEVEGWRGTIEGGKVAESHEDAMAARDEEESGDEEARAEESDQEQPEDEYDEGDEAEDEYDEGEEAEDEEPEDEYDEGEETEDEYDEDEYDEDEYEDEYEGEEPERQEKRA